MIVRMTLVLALIGALGMGACGKKDGTPPEATAPPETTAPVEADTVEAAEPDTAKAAEPDTAKAAEPDTAKAPEPDTAKAAETDTVEAAEADTVEAVEPDTVKADEDTAAAPEEGDTTAAGGEEHPDEPLIEITDSAMTEVIEDRMPVERATTFSGVGTTIQAWIEAKSDIDTEVTITWRKGDKVSFEFKMRVGKSPHWRTWARKKIRKSDAGQWYADIRDENGVLLVSMPFMIEVPAE